MAKAESLINENDVTVLKTYSDEIAGQIDSVKVQFGPASPTSGTGQAGGIEWELAKLLNIRYAINKAFKKFIDKKDIIDEEINYSKEQLANFKHDLEKNIMTLDSFRLNYTIELKALNDLKGLIDQEIKNINNAIEKYRETNPEMKKQMDKLGH